MASRRARRLGAGAVGVAAVMIAVPAWAFWSAGGTASGSTKLGTTSPILASGTATGLYPAGSADLQLTVNRVGLPALTIKSVVRDNGRSIVIAGAPGCTNPDTTVVFTASPSQTVVVPANAITTVVLPGAAQMGTASQNACQGGTFTIPVTVTGEQ